MKILNRKILSLAFLALMLSACGEKLNGSYSSGEQFGGVKGVILTLKPNGKAVYMGATEMDYEVHGAEIKLYMPHGIELLKLLDDGSIQFPMLGRLVKERS
jgi:hypothetical protein